MKIVLLLNQSYPNGYALTKRFHLYAKGFIRKGHHAVIVIPHPTEKNKNTINKSVSGVNDDVPFKYTSSATLRSLNFFLRRHHDFSGSLSAGLYLLKEKPDIIITSTFSLAFFVFLKLIALITSSKILRERNEVDNLKQDKIPTFKLKKIKYEYKLFHGSIIINQQLLDYMKTKLKIKEPGIIVPVLIEDYPVTNKPEVLQTIVYTGTYRERKDGILTIIKSFAEINKKYPDYKLVLTGSPKQSKDYKKVVEYIAANKLESQVTFTGYLSEAELWEVLFSARMLMLTKPDNRQNHYNFPTKLGEYLISARPVIATRVGVVGKILEDNVNVIFTDYNKQEISKKMEYIINNPELTDQIGKRGREFAQANFNYLAHAERMIDFFNHLKK